MKKIIIPVLLLLALGAAWFTCSNFYSLPLPEHTGKPVSHEIWDGLLKKYVKADGFVDYKNFQRDTLELKRYLDLLASSHPAKDWPRNEQMAYWINAYNAFTVQLILQNYPVKSIKDIKRGIAFVNSVWDIKFIHLGDKTYDLNNIEHGILRPDFKDARVHAAINCASYSCPRLRTEAYTAAKLEAQLDDAMRSFINDPLRNKVSPKKAEISEIFNWFGGDFKRDAGSVRSFLKKYAKAGIREDTPVSYIDYDWRLNEAN